jgi:hypothetical protein
MSPQLKADLAKCFGDDAVAGAFPDDLMPPAEAAVDLHQEESTLASWRSQDRGPPYYKFGRSVFYSRSGNARWKQQQLRTPGRHLESTE